MRRRRTISLDQGSYVTPIIVLAAVLSMVVAFTAFGFDPCDGLNRFDCNQHPECEDPPFTPHGKCYFVYHQFCDCRALTAVVTDLCVDAVEFNDGLIDLWFDSLEFSNAYDPGAGGCTGPPAVGPDAVFYVDLVPGGYLDLHMAPDDPASTFNASLYIITDCDDPEGSCVAGADQTGEGEVEDLFFESADGGVYYIILDAHEVPSEPAAILVWGEVSGSAGTGEDEDSDE